MPPAKIPTSKTAMLECVKALQTEAVVAGLDAKPELLEVRDQRGRNYLHVCAGVDVRGKPGLAAADAIPLARVLIEHGLGIDEPAFTEGTWQATPLWYAVGRGRNFALAEFLLKAGASPEHCLWAACFREDLDMLGLLVDAGATLDAVAENETPMLGAVKHSKFTAAAFLLEAGASPDFRDVHGMTALHYMLKKGSDIRHFAMFVECGARGDIADAQGKTAAEILRRKRDKAFHRVADALRSGDD